MLMTEHIFLQSSSSKDFKSHDEACFDSL